jgi:hypothetical protein
MKNNNLNYLDFATGAQLVQAVKFLLDLDEEASPAGSALRYMRLAQIDESHCRLTALLKRSTWGSKVIPSSGIVGESQFLIDGSDIKQLKEEPWVSNPMRIRATKRNEIEVQCLTDCSLSADPEMVDHITSPIYTGSFDEFRPPAFTDWLSGCINIPDLIPFRRRVAILNTFSKYANDTSHRSVWFYYNKDLGKLQVFGSEYSGADTGISLIKVGIDAQCTIEGLDKISFGVPARHLVRILNLQVNGDLNFRITSDQKHVQVWSGKDWLLLPTTEAYLSRAVSEYAPVILNNNMPLTNMSSRIFAAKQLIHKTNIQKKRSANESEGVRLRCLESHLELTKSSDLMEKDKSFALFAELTGEETPWRSLIINHSYLMCALIATYKFCQLLTEDELYEDAGSELPEDPDDLMLWTDNDLNGGVDNTDNDHLMCLTQSYSEEQELWTMFVDSVPYSEDFSICLSCSTEVSLDQIAD